ncbi:ChbG/HpnK family deacetylase [Niveispirillum irakense]|uniref:ChbG/HpnK family deacetylase n=1 Tax=Niveispirillum irakense TaxID=34011 RepID=UPI000403DDCD|nr:ChbG/HpnK family deacetylase [Niveispirillum irakense]
MSRPCPIQVVADDYALSPGVSAAILSLAREGRLTGTGAMTPSPFWREHGRALADLPPPFQAGLHVTLTGALAPLGAMPRLAPDGRFPALGWWLRHSLSGGLNAACRTEIAAEIDRQLDAFEAVMGRPPAYIDGHQHVHLLPGIRPAVLGALTRRYPAGTVWLRDCAEPAGAILARGVAPAKAAFIAALAGGLAAAAHARGIPTNAGFTGIYGFDGDFPALMRRFLSRVRPGLLIMVHPAQADHVLAGLDPVVGARQAEMAYLAGPHWPADLAASGAVLGATLA